METWHSFVCMLPLQDGSSYYYCFSACYNLPWLKLACLLLFYCLLRILFILQGLFSGPDTLFNLQHEVLLEATGGTIDSSSSSSKACSGARAAALAASSSRTNAGLQPKPLPHWITQQHSIMSSAKAGVLVLVLLAGAAGMWLAVAKGRPLLRDARCMRSSCSVINK